MPLSPAEHPSASRNVRMLAFAIATAALSSSTGCTREVNVVTTPESTRVAMGEGVGVTTSAWRRLVGTSVIGVLLVGHVASEPGAGSDTLWRVACGGLKFCRGAPPTCAFVDTNGVEPDTIVAPDTDAKWSRAARRSELATGAPETPVPFNAIWIRGVQSSAFDGRRGQVAYCVADDQPSCFAAKAPGGMNVKNVIAVNRLRAPEPIDVIWLGLVSQGASLWWGVRAESTVVARCVASRSNPTPHCRVVDVEGKGTAK